MTTFSSSFGHYIWAYSTASTSEAAYIIGGRFTRSIVARFKNDSWTQFGLLFKGRFMHGSVSLGNEILVIGGVTIEGV